MNILVLNIQSNECIKNSVAFKYRSYFIKLCIKNIDILFIPIHLHVYIVQSYASLRKYENLSTVSVKEVIYVG